MIWNNSHNYSACEENYDQTNSSRKQGDSLYRQKEMHQWAIMCLTLFIFSLGCDKRLGKCDRTSQLRTTWVCSSVPVTMLPTALSAAVWGGDKILSIHLFVYEETDSIFFIILRKRKNPRGEWLALTVFLGKVLCRTERQFWILNNSHKKWSYAEKCVKNYRKNFSKN